MKKFGAMLVLVLGIQGVLADPSAARTGDAVATIDTAAAAVAVKLAEAEAHIEKVTSQKVRHSVEEAIERSIARYDDGTRNVTVEITMAY